MNTRSDDDTPLPVPTKRASRISPKLDARKKEEICAIVRIGCMRSRAAAYVGCSMNAIATTARRDPAFADALRKAEAERELTLVRKIQEAAGEKNGWKAAAWLLERRYPDRYAARRAATMTREQVGIVLNQFAEILCRGISNRNDRLKVGAHLLRLTESLSGDAAGEQGR